MSWFGFGKRPYPDRLARRGPKLITFEEAQERLAKSFPSLPTGTVDFGGLELPVEAARSHFMVVGTTGSGKTITLKLLMRSVLSRVKGDSGWRALVFDPKNQAFSEIHAAGADMSLVTTLNPFDERSAPWDVGRDIQSPGHAREFAALLFPKTERVDPFWDDAAADLLTGATLSFIREHGTHWTLRDILLAVSHTEDLKAVLRWDEDGNEQRLARYFDSGRLSQSILTTLTVRSSLYGIVAACWHNSKKPPVSLEDWALGEGILILGHSEDYAAALDPMNRVMFRRLAELLLREPDSEKRKSWLFLDELGATGRLDHLDSLMLKGRSRGVTLVLAFQSYSSILKTYGDAADGLLEQPGNRAFLKLRGQRTAHWVEGLLGAEEYIETMKNVSISETGHSVSLNKGRVARPLVKAGELYELELPNKHAKRGIDAFYSVEGAGIYRHTISSGRISDASRPRQDAPPDLQLRPASDQRLVRWTSEERARLGLSEKQPAPERPTGGDEKLRLLEERSVYIQKTREEEWEREEDE